MDVCLLGLRSPLQPGRFGFRSFKPRNSSLQIRSFTFKPSLRTLLLRLGRLANVLELSLEFGLLALMFRMNRLSRFRRFLSDGV